MKIIPNISLKPYNTFGVDAKAKYFSGFTSVDELRELSNANAWQSIFVLGGGSNVLFTKDFDGLVLKNEIKGINIVHENEHYVDIKVGAGEKWHQFVMHCIEHNWAGVENLSLIPGSVGASPIQNIGAYGVEIKDVFYCLEAYHYADKKVYTFTLNDCEFSYRNSVFKARYKGQFVILNATYRLNKQPKFHIKYGAIEQELERMGVKTLNIRAISQAVINIRSSKLPNPDLIGNAGSFFKNPEISAAQFSDLTIQFPGIIGYKLPDEKIKLAAGWLIEQCGWKGFRRGDAGCHSDQALVLVNYGNANGAEILALGEEIRESVKTKFGVELQKEVNII
ncbi:MAG TPA: UDP-N-acetylmuramate dehydrogenase [Chitinophagaceae bacterium]|nr:UDP-N-acetylmuramate dehydrogenase [Chitinophagaceae bacterium]